MKLMVQFAAVTLLLTAVLAAAFHPAFGVLWSNPLALVGMGLIGVGLVRNAQEAAVARRRASI